VPQPLEGIRVVDFSHVVAGPLATHFLRLLGAEVIKVEPPAGDPLRDYTLVPGERGMAPAFVGINAGKRSVVLDLKTQAGRTAARRLVETADAVVENFRPGVIERLGVGYDAVKAFNPGIVYCSVSGFGQFGPMRDHPAIDQIVQSVSGLMQLSGEANSGPMRIGIPIVDTFSGLLAAFAILAALMQRERGNGDGQFIDVSMLDATMVMMLAVVNPFLIAGTRPTRSGNRGFSQAPTADTFATKDGAITIGAVQQNQVERLFRAIDRTDLLDDARFADGDLRIANGKALQAELRAAFAMRTAEEWSATLNAAGVPAGAVRAFTEVIGLPFLDQRALKQVVPLADGFTTILNAGFVFANDGPGVSEGAPLLGEHTETVLSSLDRPGKRAAHARRPLTRS